MHSRKASSHQEKNNSNDTRTRAGFRVQGLRVLQAGVSLNLPTYIAGLYTPSPAESSFAIRSSNPTPPKIHKMPRPATGA